jgi:hypothetical protein
MTTDAARQGRLASLAEQVRPTVLAAEQLLPVAAPLRPLLPDGGLRRGSILVVRNSMSLLLALAAEASKAGAWVTAASLPDLGVVAAAGQGICLDRFPMIPVIPPARWAEVVAMLADSLQVILAAPPARMGAAPARRLAARIRESRAVLITLGDPWPGPVDVQLTVETCRWEGLGQGDGFLRARMVQAASRGRGVAERPRRARLWLPDRHGRVTSADDPADDPAAESLVGVR